MSPRYRVTSRESLPLPRRQQTEHQRSRREVTGTDDRPRMAGVSDERRDSSNSFILVDDASKYIPTSNRTYPLWLAARVRYDELKPPMRPSFVVMLDIPAQHALEMTS